ncbi:MAG TPA: glycosyl hydrolase [Cytophagaceae bacterium]
MNMKCLSTLLLFSILSINCFAQEVSVGLGSYNLSPHPGEPPSPGQWDGNWFDAPAAPPRVTFDFNQQPTTHEWWTAFMWDPGLYTFPQFATWVYPYGLKTKNTYGFEIFKNRIDNVNNTFPQSFNHNDWPNQAINVGLSERVTFESVKVVEYGDWHCKIRLENNTASTMEATMVNGVPYVFIEKTGPEAVEVWMPWDPIIDNTIGTNIIGLTVQGSNYGIYFPEGSTYTFVLEANRPVNGGVINPIRKFVSDLNGKNYVVVSPLPDNSLATLQKFAQHAFVFVRGTEMNWNFNETTAKLTTTFNYTTQVMEGTETTPMIGLLPHHWKNSNAVHNGYSFEVPRGELKCVDASSFTMELDNFGFLPLLPLTGNFPHLYKYIDDQMQVNKYVTSGDNYVGGKQISKLAILTEIADFVGHTAAKDKFLAELKQELELWLTSPDAGNDGRYLYYNSTWHTLTPYYGILGPQLLNDFHFSIGYILRGAATIAKFDADWAREENWGGMVNLMIRGVNSWDRNDPLFPFMRFHSPFLGHSHAGGTSARVGGAGQESSSEAINFAAAVFQWGLNTHNTTVRDMGIYLFLTEIETSKEYWFDVENTNFPANFNSNHVWTVDGASHGKWTWFGVRPEHGLGINISLMNAHLLYLAHDVNYARELYDELIRDSREYNNNPAITEEQNWQDVILAWRATFEPATVIAKYESFGDYPYRFNYWNGEVTGVVWDHPGLDTHNDPPPAHFYHWIHALDSLGLVNSKILADYASYGVFDKDDCRHYVMYNPPGAPSRMVNFTDGQSFFLPEDTTITYKVCPETLPVQWLSFEAIKQGNNALLNWKTASEKFNSHFIIQRSDDGKDFEDIGTVQGNGTRNEVSVYSFTDYNPVQGINYYRLKQVDQDGKFVYSTIKTVLFGSNFIIYPNPASNHLYIKTFGEESIQVYNYTMLNSAGQEVLKDKFQNNTNRLDLSNLSSGLYLLMIKNDNGESIKIEKVKVE